MFLLEHDFFALKRLTYFVLYDKSQFLSCYPKRSDLGVLPPFLVYQPNSRVGLDHKPSRLSYVPDPILERKKVLKVYNPNQHDYSVDKPEMVEVRPGHFVWGNKAEIETYRKEQSK